MNVSMKEQAVAEIEAISAEQLEAARREPHRHRLPATRPSLTHKFDVAGHEGYLNIGLYEDGRPGELFITMAKEGSTVGGMMDAFATAISLCLQYGVPLDQLVKKFSHQRFEPSGMTSNRDIPFAKSIVDYVFRYMGMTFLEEYRKANMPNRGGSNKAASEAGKDGRSSEPQSAEGAPAREGSGPFGAIFPGLYVGQPGSREKKSGSSTGSGAAGNAPGGKSGASKSGQKTASNTPATQTRRVTRVDEQFSHYQDDAPACDICGSITVRNGNCYKCYNCGSSLGCS
jgi:ribonucleoside-diphosphate reductase alpha chain